ncbi:MAG: hypothetical protein ACREMC_06675 [Gemmatimonadales bacterium]
MADLYVRCVLRAQGGSRPDEMNLLRNWDEVSESVRRMRASGVVTTAFAVRNAGVPALEAADQLALAQGFAALGERWRSIDLDAARGTLARLLEKDLAYDATVMHAEDAANLADQWLGLTAPPRAFFTNGTWADPPIRTAPGATAGPSWDPITGSTFDAGVVAVDGQVTVLFWVQDED